MVALFSPNGFCGSFNVGSDSISGSLCLEGSTKEDSERNLWNFGLFCITWFVDNGNVLAEKGVVSTFFENVDSILLFGSGDKFNFEGYWYIFGWTW